MEYNEWMKYYKKLGTWNATAKALGINPSTLWRWRNKTSKGYVNRELKQTDAKIQLERIVLKTKRARNVESLNRSIADSGINPTWDTKGPINEQEAIPVYKRLLSNAVRDMRLTEDLIKHKDKMLKDRIGCKLRIYGSLIKTSKKVELLVSMEVSSILVEGSERIYHYWMNSMGEMGHLVKQFTEFVRTELKGQVSNIVWEVLNISDQQVAINYIDMEFSFQ